MEKCHETYKALFSNPNVKVEVEKIARALKDASYELRPISCTNTAPSSILFRCEGNRDKLLVGKWKKINHDDYVEVFITADIYVPEGKNLASLLEKLDVSKL